jgi:DNA-binding NtrC family response regulator
MSRKKILIVDDEKLIRWSLIQKLSQWNYDTVEAETGEDALKIFDSENPDMALLDINLPDIEGTEVLKEIKSRRSETPVVMITAFGSIEDAVSAMRMGAYDFITKPIDDLKIQSTIKNALETALLKQEVAYYKEKERAQAWLSNIIAESEEMKRILEMTEVVAQSETTIVLLQGESGTGKDLLAQSIHHLSRRQAHPYLAINCSAIPENLLESELFGYEKGAFTDAKQQKKGLAELANEGTLFLDEISTLSLPLQAKLLRFLETQTLRRVGGLKDIEVDLRVIAATNQDLDLAAKEDKFRRDLFYRLNVCPLYIPPLRQRREDILPLAKHFIQKDNIKFRKGIKGLTQEAEQLFLGYDWPGNVRELKNAIERAMIFEQSSLISAVHLPIQLNEVPEIPPSASPSRTKENSLSLEATEKDLLLKALGKSAGNKSQAAKILGISRDTLRYRIKKWDIKPEDIGPQ